MVFLPVQKIKQYKVRCILHLKWWSEYLTFLFVSRLKSINFSPKQQHQSQGCQSQGCQTGGAGAKKSRPSTWSKIPQLNSWTTPPWFSWATPFATTWGCGNSAKLIEQPFMKRPRERSPTTNSPVIVIMRALIDAYRRFPSLTLRPASICSATPRVRFSSSIIHWTKVKMSGWLRGNARVIAKCQPSKSLLVRTWWPCTHHIWGGVVAESIHWTRK